MAQTFTDDNFKETVLDSDKVSIVDFWAEWCPPCKTLGTSIEELAKEYDGRAVIGKLNADENPQVSMEFGVRSLPTILFFKNGKIVDKQVGLVPKTVLENKLKAQMQKA
jgi:thioredoxin 1